MKYLILLLFLISSISLAKDSKSKVKIFKDINDNNITIINELNLYNNTIYDNFFIDYDINDYDIGISLQNIPIYGSNEQNYEYYGYLNFSRDFSYRKSKLSIGTQLGTDLKFLIKNEPNSLHEFSYLNFSHEYDKIKFNFGIYHVNTQLSTKHQNFGIFSGITLSIIENYVIIDAQYFSGNNNISGSTINFKLINFKEVQPYLGIFVPEKNSNNDWYGIFGIILIIN